MSKIYVHPPNLCCALPSPLSHPIPGLSPDLPHFTFLFFVGMNIDTGAGDRFLAATGAGVSMAGLGLPPGVLTGEGVRAGGVMALVVSALDFAVATGVRAGAGDCAGADAGAGAVAFAVLVATVLDLASGVRVGGVNVPVPPALKVKVASGVGVGGDELFAPLEYKYVSDGLLNVVTSGFIRPPLALASCSSLSSLLKAALSALSGGTVVLPGNRLMSG